MPPQSKIDEFDLDVSLIKIKSENDKKHHAMRMEELRFIRETNQLNHDHAMEGMRIKSAEIRKAQDRRDANKYQRR